MRAIGSSNYLVIFREGKKTFHLIEDQQKQKIFFSLDFISLSNFDGKNLKLFNLWNGFQIAS